MLYLSECMSKLPGDGRGRLLSPSPSSYSSFSTNSQTVTFSVDSSSSSSSSNSDSAALLSSSPTTNITSSCSLSSGTSFAFISSGVPSASRTLPLLHSRRLNDPPPRSPPPRYTPAPLATILLSAVSPSTSYGDSIDHGINSHNRYKCEILEEPHYNSAAHRHLLGENVSPLKLISKSLKCETSKAPAENSSYTVLHREANIQKEALAYKYNVLSAQSDPCTNNSPSSAQISISENAVSASGVTDSRINSCSSSSSTSCVLFEVTAEETQENQTNDVSPRVSSGVEASSFAAGSPSHRLKCEEREKEVTQNGSDKSYPKVVERQVSVSDECSTEKTTHDSNGTLPQALDAEEVSPSNACFTQKKSNSNRTNLQGVGDENVFASDAWFTEKKYDNNKKTYLEAEVKDQACVSKACIFTEKPHDSNQSYSRSLGNQICVSDAGDFTGNTHDNNRSYAQKVEGGGVDHVGLSDACSLPHTKQISSTVITSLTGPSSTSPALASADESASHTSPHFQQVVPSLSSQKAFPFLSTVSSDREVLRSKPRLCPYTIQDAEQTTRSEGKLDSNSNSNSSRSNSNSNSSSSNSSTSSSISLQTNQAPSCPDGAAGVPQQQWGPLQERQVVALSKSFPMHRRHHCHSLAQLHKEDGHEYLHAASQKKEDHHGHVYLAEKGPQQYQHQQHGNPLSQRQQQTQQRQRPWRRKIQHQSKQLSKFVRYYQNTGSSYDAQKSVNRKEALYTTRSLHTAKALCEKRATSPYKRAAEKFCRCCCFEGTSCRSPTKLPLSQLSVHRQGTQKNSPTLLCLPNNTRKATSSSSFPSFSSFSSSAVQYSAHLLQKLLCLTQAAERRLLSLRSSRRTSSSPYFHQLRSTHTIVCKATQLARNLAQRWIREYIIDVTARRRLPSHKSLYSHPQTISAPLHCCRDNGSNTCYHICNVDSHIYKSTRQSDNRSIQRAEDKYGVNNKRLISRSNEPNSGLFCDTSRSSSTRNSNSGRRTSFINSSCSSSSYCSSSSCCSSSSSSSCSSSISCSSSSCSSCSSSSCSSRRGWEGILYNLSRRRGVEYWQHYLNLRRRRHKRKIISHRIILCSGRICIKGSGSSMRRYLSHRRTRFFTRAASAGGARCNKSGKQDVSGNGSNSSKLTQAPWSEREDAECHRKHVTRRRRKLREKVACDTREGHTQSGRDSRDIISTDNVGESLLLKSRDPHRPCSRQWVRVYTSNPLCGTFLGDKLSAYTDSPSCDTVLDDRLTVYTDKPVCDSVLNDRLFVYPDKCTGVTDSNEKLSVYIGTPIAGTLVGDRVSVYTGMMPVCGTLLDDNRLSVHGEKPICDIALTDDRLFLYTCKHHGDDIWRAEGRRVGCCDRRVTFPTAGRRLLSIPWNKVFGNVGKTNIRSTKKNFSTGRYRTCRAEQLCSTMLHIASDGHHCAGAAAFAGAEAIRKTYYIRKGEPYDKNAIRLQCLQQLQAVAERELYSLPSVKEEAKEFLFMPLRTEGEQYETNKREKQQHEADQQQKQQKQKQQQHDDDEVKHQERQRHEGKKQLVLLLQQEDKKKILQQILWRQQRRRLAGPQTLLARKRALSRVCQRTVRDMQRIVTGDGTDKEKKKKEKTVSPAVDSRNTSAAVCGETISAVCGSTSSEKRTEDDVLTKNFSAECSPQNEAGRGDRFLPTGSRAVIAEPRGDSVVMVNCSNDAYIMKSRGRRGCGFKGTHSRGGSGSELAFSHDYRNSEPYVCSEKKVKALWILRGSDNNYDREQIIIRESPLSDRDSASQTADERREKTFSDNITALPLMASSSSLPSSSFPSSFSSSFPSSSSIPFPSPSCASFSASSSSSLFSSFSSPSFAALPPAIPLQTFTWSPPCVQPLQSSLCKREVGGAREGEGSLNNIIEPPAFEGPSCADLTRDGFSSESKSTVPFHEEMFLRALAICLPYFSLGTRIGGVALASKSCMQLVWSVPVVFADFGSAPSCDVKSHHSSIQKQQQQRHHHQQHHARQRLASAPSNGGNSSNSSTGSGNGSDSSHTGSSHSSSISSTSVSSTGVSSTSVSSTGVSSTGVSSTSVSGTSVSGRNGSSTSVSSTRLSSTSVSSTSVSGTSVSGRNGSSTGVSGRNGSSTSVSSTSVSGRNGSSSSGESTDIASSSSSSSKRGSPSMAAGSNSSSSSRGRGSESMNHSGSGGSNEAPSHDYLNQHEQMPPRMHLSEQENTMVRLHSCDERQQQPLQQKCERGYPLQQSHQQQSPDPALSDAELVCGIYPSNTQESPPRSRKSRLSAKEVSQKTCTTSISTSTSSSCSSCSFCSCSSSSSSSSSCSTQSDKDTHTFCGAAVAAFGESGISLPSRSSSSADNNISGNINNAGGALVVVKAGVDASVASRSGPGVNDIEERKKKKKLHCCIILSQQQRYIILSQQQSTSNKTTINSVVNRTIVSSPLLSRRRTMGPAILPTTRRSLGPIPSESMATTIISPHRSDEGPISSESMATTVISTGPSRFMGLPLSHQSVVIGSISSDESVVPPISHHRRTGPTSCRRAISLMSKRIRKSFISRRKSFLMMSPVSSSQINNMDAISSENVVAVMVVVAATVSNPTTNPTSSLRRCLATIATTTTPTTTVSRERRSALSRQVIDTILSQQKRGRVIPSRNMGPLISCGSGDTVITTKRAQTTITEEEAEEEGGDLESCLRSKENKNNKNRALLEPRRPADAETGRGGGGGAAAAPGGGGGGAAAAGDRVVARNAGTASSSLPLAAVGVETVVRRAPPPDVVVALPEANTVTRPGGSLLGLPAVNGGGAGTKREAIIGTDIIGIAAPISAVPLAAEATTTQTQVEASMTTITTTTTAENATITTAESVSILTAESVTTTTGESMGTIAEIASTTTAENATTTTAESVNTVTAENVTTTTAESMSTKTAESETTVAGESVSTVAGKSVSTVAGVSESIVAGESVSTRVDAESAAPPNASREEATIVTVEEGVTLRGRLLSQVVERTLAPPPPPAPFLAPASPLLAPASPLLPPPPPRRADTDRQGGVLVLEEENERTAPTCKKKKESSSVVHQLGEEQILMLPVFARRVAPLLLHVQSLTCAAACVPLVSCLGPALRRLHLQQIQPTHLQLLHAWICTASRRCPSLSSLTLQTDTSYSKPPCVLPPLPARSISCCFCCSCFWSCRRNTEALVTPTDSMRCVSDGNNNNNAASVASTTVTTPTPSGSTSDYVEATTMATSGAATRLYRGNANSAAAPAPATALIETEGDESICERETIIANNGSAQTEEDTAAPPVVGMEEIGETTTTPVTSISSSSVRACSGDGGGVGGGDCRGHAICSCSSGEVCGGGDGGGGNNNNNNGTYSSTRLSGGGGSISGGTISCGGDDNSSNADPLLFASYYQRNSFARSENPPLKTVSSINNCRANALAPGALASNNSRASARKPPKRVLPSLRRLIIEGVSTSDVLQLVTEYSLPSLRRLEISSSALLAAADLVSFLNGLHAKLFSEAANACSCCCWSGMDTEPSACLCVPFTTRFFDVQQHNQQKNIPQQSTASIPYSIKTTNADSNAHTSSPVSNSCSSAAAPAPPPLPPVPPLGGGSGVHGGGMMMTTSTATTSSRTNFSLHASHAAGGPAVVASRASQRETVLTSPVVFSSGLDTTCASVSAVDHHMINTASTTSFCNNINSSTSSSHHNDSVIIYKTLTNSSVTTSPPYNTSNILISNTCTTSSSSSVVTGRGACMRGSGVSSISSSCTDTSGTLIAACTSSNLSGASCIRSSSDTKNNNSTGTSGRRITHLSSNSNSHLVTRGAESKRSGIDDEREEADMNNNSRDTPPPTQSSALAVVSHSSRHSLLDSPSELWERRGLQQEKTFRKDYRDNSSHQQQHGMLERNGKSRSFSQEISLQAEGDRSDTSVLISDDVRDGGRGTRRAAVATATATAASVSAAAAAVAETGSTAATTASTEAAAAAETGSTTATTASTAAAATASTAVAAAAATASRGAAVASRAGLTGWVSRLAAAAATTTSTTAPPPGLPVPVPVGLPSPPREAAVRISTAVGGLVAASPPGSRNEKRGLELKSFTVTRRHNGEEYTALQREYAAAIAHASEWTRRYAAHVVDACVWRGRGGGGDAQDGRGVAVSGDGAVYGNHCRSTSSSSSKSSSSRSSRDGDEVVVCSHCDDCGSKCCCCCSSLFGGEDETQRNEKRLRSLTRLSAAACTLREMRLHYANNLCWKPLLTALSCCCSVRLLELSCAGAATFGLRTPFFHPTVAFLSLPLHDDVSWLLLLPNVRILRLTLKSPLQPSHDARKLLQHLPDVLLGLSTRAPRLLLVYIHLTLAAPVSTADDPIADSASTNTTSSSSTLSSDVTGTSAAPTESMPSAYAPIVCATPPLHTSVAACQPPQATASPCAHDSGLTCTVNSADIPTGPPPLPLPALPSPAAADTSITFFASHESDGAALEPADTPPARIPQTSSPLHQDWGQAQSIPPLAAAENSSRDGSPSQYARAVAEPVTTTHALSTHSATANAETAGRQQHQGGTACRDTAEQQHMPLSGDVVSYSSTSTTSTTVFSSSASACSSLSSSGTSISVSSRASPHTSQICVSPFTSAKNTESPHHNGVCSSSIISSASETDTWASDATKTCSDIQLPIFARNQTLSLQSPASDTNSPSSVALPCGGNGLSFTSAVSGASSSQVPMTQTYKGTAANTNNSALQAAAAVAHAGGTKHAHEQSAIQCTILPSEDGHPANSNCRLSSALGGTSPEGGRDAVAAAPASERFPTVHVRDLGSHRSSSTARPRPSSARESLSKARSSASSTSPCNSLSAETCSGQVDSRSLGAETCSTCFTPCRPFSSSACRTSLSAGSPMSSLRGPSCTETMCSYSSGSRACSASQTSINSSVVACSSSNNSSDCSSVCNSSNRRPGNAQTAAACPRQPPAGTISSVDSHDACNETGCWTDFSRQSPFPLSAASGGASCLDASDASPSSVAFTGSPTVTHRTPSLSCSARKKSCVHSDTHRSATCVAASSMCGGKQPACTCSKQVGRYKRGPVSACESRDVSANDWRVLQEGKRLRAQLACMQEVWRAAAGAGETSGATAVGTGGAAASVTQRDVSHARKSAGVNDCKECAGVRHPPYKLLICVSSGEVEPLLQRGRLPFRPPPVGRHARGGRGRKSEADERATLERDTDAEVGKGGLTTDQETTVDHSALLGNGYKRKSEDMREVNKKDEEEEEDEDILQEEVYTTTKLFSGKGACERNRAALIEEEADHYVEGVGRAEWSLIKKCIAALPAPCPASESPPCCDAVTLFPGWKRHDHACAAWTVF